ncbi:hypothetical protein [Lacipirellula limnantheis]|uniref:Glycosyl transferase family 2 n=1 Tax=Lacipirellula limnantheis TaxID=2528024 RepID=A0A517TRC1_9BACT|nr:hypothetical protein [Lacipirellula limnantheis]QDT70923.1 hypothetical protein I41_00760 [Lacipirellula limnantheis]
MRLVTVTPAGRRPYLEILANYLLRRRDLIDHHQWWLNTRVPDDVAYIYRLADRYPSFFRVVAKPVGPQDRIGYTIWRYMSECTDAETIYLRLDDDICYMADDAIQQMRDARMARPEPLLILGNIVNNAVCSHFHQRAGLLPNSWGTVANDCMDANGWRSGAFARRLHRRFLKDLAAGRETWWRRAAMPVDGTARFSINAICWRGDDFREIPETRGGEVDEEPFLTADMPRRLGRPNVICTDALFGHYAFLTQRPFLERTSPEILASYRQLSEQAAASPHLPLLEQSYLRVRRAVGVSGWYAEQGFAKAGELYRTGKQFVRGRRAA